MHCKAACGATCHTMHTGPCRSQEQDCSVISADIRHRQCGHAWHAWSKDTKSASASFSLLAIQYARPAQAEHSLLIRGTTPSSKRDGSRPCLCSWRNGGRGFCRRRAPQLRLELLLEAPLVPSSQGPRLSHKEPRLVLLLPLRRRDREPHLHDHYHSHFHRHQDFKKLRPMGD